MASSPQDSSLPAGGDRCVARAPIRVFIIAEIRLYREALARLMKGHEGVTVVGGAVDAKDGMGQIRSTSAEVVLVDIATGSGIACIRELSRARPDLRVLALGVSETGDDVVASAEAGAVGYIFRGASAEQAIHAVKCAAKGEAVLSPRTAATLLTRVRSLAAGRRREEVATLTNREVDVLTLIEKGLTNKEIAAALSIELSTVKNHVHSILQKLHLRRRSEAKAWLRERTRSDA